MLIRHKLKAISDMKNRIQMPLALIVFMCFNLLVKAQAHHKERELIVTDLVDSIYSNVQKTYRKFWVKLPENYNPSSDSKYPVVYLLDGFALKNNLVTVYDNYWGHYMPHMILVGLSNATNRTFDLTTSEIKSRHGAAFSAKTGGADQFVRFIESELIPHIDSHFPTTTHRTLIGHSYGGLFTINMLLNHAHLFNNYIAIDPSLDWDDQKLLKQCKAILASKHLENKSLFVSLAAEQLHMFDESITLENIKQDQSEFTLFARSIIEFSEFVSDEVTNGLNFSWKVYPEDLHGTVPLPSIRDGLVHVFGWYQFISPQKYNNSETTLSELNQLLKTQEEIYTKNFGYSSPPMLEELFVGYAQMFFQTGQHEKARLFINKAIEYYPNGTEAYDAMVDYYQTISDKTNAIKCATKAYEISKSTYHKDRLDALKN